MPRPWAILTGEYPPQPGGVSDYTRHVAAGLARAGDEVHVWAPPCAAEAPADPGVAVHRLADRFGPASLAALAAGVDRLRAPRLLVQYVPQALGRHAMNVPLCRWLGARPGEVWVMFHEVVAPWRLAPHHAVQAAVTRLMARHVACAASRVFVSVPLWRRFLPRAVRARAAWLPVPSTLPTQAPAADVARVRAQLGGQLGPLVIGHLGTYPRWVERPLHDALAALLVPPERRALLLGRGGPAAAARLLAGHPALAGRVVAPGELPGDALASHLAACDLVLQPYPDGASGRRTSLVAALALGRAAVTTRGPSTEPVWDEAQAVRFAAAASGPALFAAAEPLAHDPDGRARLGARGAALYAARFALEHTLAALRDPVAGA